jgi:hypothetical protein
MLNGWVVDMAAVPYRIYLLFSSLIPSLIYAIVATVLVGLLTLRVDENDGLSITLFFTALCFTGCFRMVKDLWSIWPYAIYAKKFKVDSEDEKNIIGKPTYSGYLERPFLMAFILSAVPASLVFIVSYYLVPFAFSQHLSILWVIGAFIFPLVMFFTILIAADLFYRSYDKADTTCMALTMKSYINRFYLYPEALCFLLLNFAIISPLNSVQQATFDVAWVTMLVTISITTFLLLMSAHSNPINYIIGGLNSKLISIVDRDKFNVGINKKDIKDLYKIRKFSLAGWWVLIVFVQIVIATVFMKNFENWFYSFLMSAQVVWMISYLYLRNYMLISSIKQIVQYHDRDDLQEGYMDLNASEEVAS